MQRFFRLAPLLVVAFLTACPSDVGPGSPPQIISFTPTPASISAPGQAVTLSWEISGSVTNLEIDQGVGQVTGSDIVVNPTATTTYTLTASNSSGSDTQSTIVTFGTGGGDLVEDGLPPTLTTFGVSLEQTGFQNDQAGDIESPSDPRIVRVQPGGTFYAVVSATDPGGIAGVNVFIANSSPPGLRADLVQGQSVNGFTLTGEVGGCLLDGTQTAVTCIYEIAVGNIPNIDELEGAGSEFAYVFRTRVTDNAGLVADVPPRGYVIVGESGGGTPPPSNPTPPPPGEPTPPPPGNPTPPPSNPSPGNRPPTANAGANQNNIALNTTVSLNGSGRDSDGTIAGYSWILTAPDRSNVSSSLSSTTVRTPSFRVTQVGTYVASLKVKDNDGAESAADTVNITVVADTSEENQAPTADAGRDQSNVTVNTTVTLDGSGSRDPNSGDTLTYAWTLRKDGVDASNLLNNPATVRPTFRPSQAGSYVASLVVTDDEDLSSRPDTVTVTVVEPPANSSPIAIAGPDQTRVPQGSTVRLDGSGSSDPDDGETPTLRFAWSLKAPNGTDVSASLNNRNTAMPTFNATDIGEYVASLVVTDINDAPSSSTSQSSVSIFVIASTSP